MHFALVVLTIIGAASAGTVLDTVPFQQRLFEKEINNTINSIVGLLKEHDPITVDHAETSILGHSGSVDNLLVSGFSNIYASHIKLSGLTTWTLELVLEAPNRVVSVDNWKLDGDVIYGDGAAKIQITNAKLTISAKINILSVSISDVKVVPSNENAQVSITGIKNDEQLSKEVSDKISNFLNETLNNVDWQNQVNELIQAVIDKVLGWIKG